MTTFRGLLGLNRGRQQSEQMAGEPVEEEVDELEMSQSQPIATADELVPSHSTSVSASEPSKSKSGQSAVQSRAVTGPSTAGTAVASSSIEAPAPGQGHSVVFTSQDPPEAGNSSHESPQDMVLASAPSTETAAAAQTNPTTTGQVTTSVRSAAAAFGLTGDTGGVKLPPPDGIMKASKGGIQANG